MAEYAGPPLGSGVAESPISFPRSVEEARVLAKQRFKERLAKGEKVGNCSCHDDTADENEISDGTGQRVVGARFIDSGQVYFFSPGSTDLENGDWIVVETSRGQEAARVVIAPHQVAASQLKGELKPIVRKMSTRDVERMESFRKESASAIRTFRAAIRAHDLPMKPISAEYSFDGSHLTLNFSAADRVDFRELARDLNQRLRCRVELRQVSARDEARLLGGVGRCGRTLCCSTWLPMFPEINMGMSKTQDLSLNPSKVSGVCGRLLCCLSYENDQYKQMKAVMPKLGQKTDTPHGMGTVVSLQLLKGLVTVLLDEENTEETFQARELGFGEVQPAPIQVIRKPKPQESAPVATAAVDADKDEPDAAAADIEAAGDSEAPGQTKSGRKRKRRSRRRGKSSGAQMAQSEQSE